MPAYMKFYLWRPSHPETLIDITEPRCELLSSVDILKKKRIMTQNLQYYIPVCFGDFNEFNIREYHLKVNEICIYN